MRKTLNNMLHQCATCRVDFYENVAMILGPHGTLTDEQVQALVVYFQVEHRDHV